jgi:PfaD family protein
MSPAPQKILQELVAQGALSNEQARMAEHVPIAQDVTAEADSGGHTDNRPAISLLPTILALRDRIQAQYRYTKHLRVGAAGGIATPSSAAAAFAMGASYVVTGSVNQSCVESGSSDAVRQMLAEAGQADTIMAPAADMFEMGVKVQVLKRGTMFAMRAARLYDLYRTYKSIEDIPTPERLSLEKTTFRAPLTEIWRQTEDYFHRIDPAQVAKARSDPHHQMALVFRWYLGLASRWANSGESGRQLDYQVWCGPSMGAFNEWVKGTHLEDFRQRHVAEIGRQIMLGAAICLRIAFLRIQGAFIPAEMGAIPVASSARLEEYVPEGLV